ncbi:MAG: hypothetical protein LBG52_04870 [Candidatus Peribacteria bacterium]|nr:hypothetical protein [Candidatus Peribacteria bacterium]
MDNLTYLQTKKHEAGIEKFCFEWDEQIIADRALLSELYDEMKNLTTHEYELGLN